MTHFRLSRRYLLAAAPSLLLAARARADMPYQAHILWGGFDGTAYQGGLHVVMLPGWKTYWRVPGAGGIPPSLEASGSNAGSFTFACPLPHRIPGEEGESIGYKGEVVFPFTLLPLDAETPVTVKVNAFIGICETVCIPVPVSAQHELSPMPAMNGNDPLLFDWRARVPKQVSSGPVVSAAALEVDKAYFIDLTLSRPVDDLFVEGHALHFFNAPAFAADGLKARVKVNGVKSLADLRADPLRITVDAGGEGLEQMLPVV